MLALGLAAVVGRGRGAAAAARPDDASPRRPAVGDSEARQRDRAARAAAARVRAVRPVPADRRPCAAEHPARSARARIAQVCASPVRASCSITANGVRARGRGVGLGRPPASRRHCGARRRGCRRDPRGGATSRNRSSSTADATSPCSGCAGSPQRRSASPTRCRGRRRDPRLSRRTARSTRAPGRIGGTADVLLNGSLREVTAVSGLIRHGNSGGPAVNAAGDVEATIFAARVGGGAGYGVPASADPPCARAAHGPVSTGSC